MNEWLDRSRDRRGGVTIPRIWIAAGFSILVHIIALWQWLPHLRRPSDLDALEKPSGPLVVQLERRAPPPSRPAPAVPQRRPTPPAVARPAPKPAPKPAPAPRPEAPPVIAMNKPVPSAPPAPPPAPATPAPQRPPAEDLSALIEARRRARGESPPQPQSAAPSPSMSAAPPAEDENARANRIAAANLGLDRKPTFGEPRRGGGVFSIQRMGYDYAEFVFYGWNKDIRRNTQQVIEVRKGNNADIRIAVVRRMIAIIRDYEQGDFVWESQRLGRNITLSARQRDNTGLEAFLMREFFDDFRQ